MSSTANGRSRPSWTTIFGGISQPDIAYDTVVSEIAPSRDAAASEVAQRLDTEVLDLLRHVTGAPAPATA